MWGWLGSYGVGVGEEGGEEGLGVGDWEEGKGKGEGGVDAR